MSYSKITLNKINTSDSSKDEKDIKLSLSTRPGITQVYITFIY